MKACLGAKKRPEARRKALLRMAQRRLPRQPAFAYYLSLGEVPTSMSVFDE